PPRAAPAWAARGQSIRAPGFGRATPAATVGEEAPPAAEPTAAPPAAAPAAPALAAPAPAAVPPAAPLAPAAPATAAPATPATPAARRPSAPRSSPRNDSSASAISAADANRSSGLGASALRSIVSSVGGMPPCAADGLGTAPVRRAVAIAAAVSPVHGRRRVSSSYSTMPRL